MNHVALPPLNTIELCAGVGMLGVGVSAGLEYLGINNRTVCYVEREAPAAAQLVALMEAGALAPAPVWSDMLTFDAGAWRNAVDCVIAGFPCQDLSIAGRRAGLDGKRSGLFFTVLDIADACGAWLLVLENVSGIASATASVVDEAEGELEERAAARVLGELADRGWNTEWITLPASDVGASHERNRWFCIAWRMADARCGDARRGEYLAGTCGRQAQHSIGIEALDHTGRVQRRAGHDQDRPRSPEAGKHEAHDRPADRGGYVAHPGLQHQHLQQRAHGAEHSGSGQPLAHAERAERRQERVGGIGSIQGHDARGRQENDRPGVADEALGDSEGDHRRGQQPAGTSGSRRAGLAGAGAGAGVGQAHASRDGWDEGRAEPGGEQGRLDAAQRGRAVSAGVGQADTGKPGLPQPEQPVLRGAGRGVEGGATEQLCGAPLFAPGPADPIWRGLLNAGRLGAWSRAVTDDEAGACPWAPATKPGVRMLADGVALLVDESRNHQLRQVGNGVVPLQAAYATVVLVRRAGIMMHSPINFNIDHPLVDDTEVIKASKDAVIRNNWGEK